MAAQQTSCAQSACSPSRVRSVTNEIMILERSMTEEPDFDLTRELPSAVPHPGCGAPDDNLSFLQSSQYLAPHY